MNACLVLQLILCTTILLCHSFILAPNSNTGKIRQTRTSSTVATVLNAKEEDDDDDDDFEWDGVAVEGAHDADFESIDASDNFVPSISFMSMANSVASPALTAASAGSGVMTKQTVDDFDPLKNAGILHRMAMEDELNEDSLMEMGGDPAFLDDIDENKNDDDDDSGLSMEEMNDLMESGGDPAFFGWDGTVDEDAHLDF